MPEHGDSFQRRAQRRCSRAEHQHLPCPAASVHECTERAIIARGCLSRSTALRAPFIPESAAPAAPDELNCASFSSASHLSGGRVESRRRRDRDTIRRTRRHRINSNRLTLLPDHECLSADGFSFTPSGASSETSARKRSCYPKAGRWMCRYPWPA